MVKSSALLWFLCQILQSEQELERATLSGVHPRVWLLPQPYSWNFKFVTLDWQVFTHPLFTIVAEAAVEYANVAVLVTQVWGLNSLSQMVPLLNQSRWIKTIPAWRLESSIVPTHFVPPQLHSSTTSVFFRIHSCQLGPCSHSFPLYNLIRVSIHSICMALLWLGRRRKLLKLGRKGKPETGASPNTNLLPEEQGLSNEPQLLLQLKQWNYSLKVWHVFSQKETIPTEHLEKEYR